MSAPGGARRSRRLTQGFFTCCVDGCGTPLQPYGSGGVDPTDVEGLAAHLATVHGLPGPRALAMATQLAPR